MRTEAEVLEQLIAFAQAHPQIRAVWLNGSRVNPNLSKDIFCDYDAVYLVEEPRHFLDDQSWIAYFGETIIIQQNDWSEDGLSGHIFLMLFSDGVRIDLSFDPLEMVQRGFNDSLTVALLDKDGRLPPLPPPSEASYYPARPTPRQFAETVNEFWWCSTNVAKGLWRGELCYVRHMYDVIVKEMLVTVLGWHIQVRHGWRVNTGSYGKWYQKYLPPEIWRSFEQTYAGADFEATWQALFEAGRLMSRLGPEVAAALGYPYPQADEQRVTAYLHQVHQMTRGGSYE
jgi:aminoglycoside 6-adenylyltransferase